MPHPLTRTVASVLIPALAFGPACVCAAQDPGSTPPTVGPANAAPAKPAPAKTGIVNAAPANGANTNVLPASVNNSDLVGAPVEMLDQVQIVDVPLRQALDVIAVPSGLNIAATEDAAKTRVSLRLHDVTPFDAVQTLCETHNLFFRKPQTPNGIGVVSTVKEFQEGLTVFREEKTRVYTLLYPNAVDLAVAVHDLFGTRVRVTLGKEGVYDESDEIQRRFTRFDLLDSRSQGLTQFITNGGNGSSGSNGSNNSNTNNTNSRTTSGGSPTERSSASSSRSSTPTKIRTPTSSRISTQPRWPGWRT